MKYLVLCILILLVNVIQGQDTTPPVTPLGVKGFSYEKHFAIEWESNTEPDLAGYKIYLSNGSGFNYFATVAKNKSLYTYFIQSIGITKYFKVSAIDQTGNESPLSDSVVCTSHLMTDDEFLDMVQRATFRYFWNWGDPVSGVARERWAPDEGDLTNTTGGGGFGVMAILVGIERGFITREQGVERILKISDFLANKVKKFHGAFPHWFNGTTGDVVNFGVQDGGDIVETAFMLQGLLAARQYFVEPNDNEIQIRALITQIWENVEWDFYRNNSSGLYWNWSPTMGFNFSDTFIFHGWNETLIPYLLSIASPTNPVNLNAKSFYQSGWGNSGLIKSVRQIYGYQLFVGSSYGGPLFFTHYSFLGFDPRYKKDMYTNYFTHNRNQSLVNRQYCISNPKHYNGYNENCWGLTASYSIPGVDYLAHDPSNDNGTIAPTAALSSMPYTPDESIAALKYFYRNYYLNLWGEYGFKDAFNLTYSSNGVSGQWFSKGYLAIDQGPIIVMIENYRSGLLWNLFMSNSEIQTALNTIGFVSDSTTAVEYENKPVKNFSLVGNYPNPFNPTTTIVFNLPERENVNVSVFNYLGEKVKELADNEFNIGENKVIWDGQNGQNEQVGSGVYLYKITTNTNVLYGKMILQK